MLYCASRVLALCNIIVATMLWFRESFFFFFPFKYWCKLIFILLYWHNKFNKSGYAATILQHCASRVLALCSTVAATVLWFREFFFPLNIDVSWHLYCYTDTTNFTIFSQLLSCQFLTSRNKIIKYETVANHNWK